MLRARARQLLVPAGLVAACGMALAGCEFILPDADVSEPRMRFTAVPDTLTTQTDWTVSGVATAGRGVGGISYRIGSGPSQDLPISPGQTVHFSFGVALAEGPTDIRVTVHDRGGRPLVADSVLTVRVDRTAPVVEILSPDDGWELQSDTLVFSLRASDEGPIVRFQYRVRTSAHAYILRSIPIDPKSSIERTEAIDLGSDSDRVTGLEVIAVDGVGNVGSSSITLVGTSARDRTPPEVWVYGPHVAKPGSMAAIVVTARDESGVDRVIARNASLGSETIEYTMAVAEVEWDVSVPIGAGENWITGDAVDIHENSTVGVATGGVMVSGRGGVVQTGAACLLFDNGALECDPETYEEPGWHMSGIVQLAASGTHVCVLDQEGAAHCRGMSHDPSPHRVDAPAPFRRIVSGASFSCGLDNAGRVWCWGDFLSSTDQTGAFREARLVFSEPVLSTLTAGASHVCGIAENGLGYCAGRNQVGQLGDGTTDFREALAPIAGDLRWTELASFDARTCGVDADHRVRCWGASGVPNSWSATPVERSAGTPFGRVVPGYRHDYAFSLDGSVWRWEPGDVPAEPFQTPGEIHRTIIGIEADGHRFWTIDGALYYFSW